MNVRAEAEKGEKAQRLLDSESWKEAFVATRQAILEKWAASPIRDQEGQHELRLLIKLMDDLEGHIKSVANTGKLAKAQIEEENRAKELAKRAIAGLASWVR